MKALLRQRGTSGIAALVDRHCCCAVVLNGPASSAEDARYAGRTVGSMG